ncbi:MAG: hypothetical protein ACXVDN_04665 [Ktedonobacteraceae bacterium]
MDPITIALASQVISVLVPFVSKAADEFASKVGDAAFDKASAILGAIKKKWAGDPVASADLTRFEQNPQVFQTVLQDTLQKKLSDDKELADLLSQLLHDMGPSLEVVQKMDVGKNVIGFEGHDMKSGSASVTQEIKQADGVTGIKLNDLG